MTPLERANQIVNTVLPELECGKGRREQARDLIHASLIEAASAEVERRRIAENRLASLLRAVQDADGGLPRVVIVEGRAYLEFKDALTGEVFRWDGVRQSPAQEFQDQNFR